MKQEEAARIYDSSSDDDKRLYGVLGILYFSNVMPAIMKLIRRLIYEKSN